jgi:hypothetical protein
MHADVVGEMTANAIEQNKFWILTDPRWSNTLREQLDSMAVDQTLTET